MATKRHHAGFTVEHLQEVKDRLLAWAGTYAVAVYLDSNEYPNNRHHTWECLVAAGAADRLEANAGQAFPQFRQFYEEKQDWLFGFFGYDLKNEVEKLHSRNPDGIGLPDLFFFQPEIVVGIRSLKFKEGENPDDPAYRLEVFSLKPLDKDFARFSGLYTQAETSNSKLHPEASGSNSKLHPRIPKPAYLHTVEAIRRHIIEGDLYEMNLCQEFFSENAEIDPLHTFRRLNRLARAPFSAYLRCNDRHVLCASPERFLRKEGDTLVSQPIKGTRRRHPDATEDSRIREELRVSEKDRAENVMIVDLVRNDLARHCRPGAVQVEELFGIYTFETVHQMISTVVGTLRPGEHALDALRDAFPMGSMTGAPKVMAMELIEQYEQTRRGLFSGAVGYFSPDGNFDFNVVIRSILYNAATRYLSCQVGGAIVYDSVPEQEYEECLVKIGAMKKALSA